MDNLSNKIQTEGEIPKEVVDFMDGRMAGWRLKMNRLRTLLLRIFS